MKDELARAFWRRVDLSLDGATLKDVCEKAGLNYTSVRNRRSGAVYSLPRLENGYQLAHNLGVSLEYLLTGQKTIPYNARIKAIADSLVTDPDRLDAVEILLFGKKAGVSSKLS